MMSESGSLERRGTGLPDCPCFVDAEVWLGAREAADSSCSG
jgi:hypothetical protein